MGFDGKTVLPRMINCVCSPSRDTPRLLGDGRFQVVELQRRNLPGRPRIAGYNPRGSAGHLSH